MVYRFTNSKGRHHWGIAVEMLGNGAYVLSDAWEPNEKSAVPASFGYICFDRNPFVIAEVKHELLPLDTPVEWRTPEISQIIEMMKSGEFAEWWTLHRGEVVRSFGSGYRH